MTWCPVVVPFVVSALGVPVSVLSVHSSATNTTIEIDTFYKAIDFYTSIARFRFEEFNQVLFCSTLKPVKKVLRDSKIVKGRVHETSLSVDPLAFLVLSSSWTITSMPVAKRPTNRSTCMSCKRSAAVVQAAILSEKTLATNS